MSALASIETIHGSIVDIRGRPVIFDSDLAAYFEVETRSLNQAARRNSARFEDYAFHLTGEEMAALRDRGVLARLGRGGRRTPAWVYTEHGVVMAATVLNSERAVKASRRVVEAFVTLKRSTPGTDLTATVVKPGPGEVAGSQFLSRLRNQFETLMDTEINPRQRKTIRQETETFISEGIESVKARLKRQGLDNEEVQARVLKYIAEAEETRARAATQRQMTERQRLKNQANQLRLMIRAEIAMASGEMSDLLEVLDELGKD